MKILFTGGSSFTGCWFIRELAAAGHEVLATFTGKDVASYDEEHRRARVELALEVARPLFDCRFGDDRFLAAIREAAPVDVLCHHAADVSNYRSPDFDVHAALANNTRNLSAVLTALREGGCQSILLTGSIFEQGEGVGSDGLPNFSPYGLSKALTWQVFRHHAPLEGLRLAKFVIPNPFGPHEEPRFTAYLVRNWFAGEVPAVNTPAYVRDNIHISLLAKVYAQYLREVVEDSPEEKLHPSGYVESQGAFAERFAAAMRPRLGLPCGLVLKDQTEFHEPLVRINTSDSRSRVSDWSEGVAWDEIARYYAERFASQKNQ